MLPRPPALLGSRLTPLAVCAAIALLATACVSNPTPHPGTEDSGGAGGSTGLGTGGSGGGSTGDPGSDDGATTGSGSDGRFDGSREGTGAAADTSGAAGADAGVPAPEADAAGRTGDVDGPADGEGDAGPDTGDSLPGDGADGGPELEDAGMDPSEDTAAEDTAAEDIAAEDTAAEDTAAEDTTAEDTAAEDTAAEDDAGDAAAVEPTGPLFTLGSMTAGDAGEDGAWSPGEDLLVSVSLTNASGEDYMAYPGVRLEADQSWATVESPDFSFFGLFAGQSNEAFFTVHAAAEAPVGATVTLTTTVFALNCETSGLGDCPYAVPATLTISLAE